MIKNLAFPTTVGYNNDNKMDLAEPYLKGSIVFHAKRTQIYSRLWDSLLISENLNKRGG